MATTIVGVGDVKAVKAWATTLAVDVKKKMKWANRKWIGTDPNAIIHEKTQLESDPGDRVSFDLLMSFRGDVIEGDDVAEGREEDMQFYTDEVRIDQVRKPGSAGGRMSRKRQVHDLRKLNKELIGKFLAEWSDQAIFAYLSGGLGINQDFKFRRAFAGNPFQAPDAAHQMFGGSATSIATITTADGLTKQVFERVGARARMMNAIDLNTPQINPVTVEGEERYLSIINPWQETGMRQQTGEGGWLEMTRALATAVGNKSDFVRGGTGMINGIVIHTDASIIRYNNFGAGANLPGARALFLGAQAGAIAYGTTTKQRYFWNEELRDFGNKVAMAAGAIVGIKKTRFNDRDFGVISIDTYAVPVN
jgi:N4-gp56 family major capsid protein